MACMNETMQVFFYAAMLPAYREEKRGKENEKSFNKETEKQHSVEHGSCVLQHSMGPV